MKRNLDAEHMCRLRYSVLVLPRPEKGVSNRKVARQYCGHGVFNPSVQRSLPQYISGYLVLMLWNDVYDAMTSFEMETTLCQTKKFG